MGDLHFPEADPDTLIGYAGSLIRSLRQTRMRILQLKRESAVWEKRISLADKKGKIDLGSQARIMGQNIMGDLRQLAEEERELVTELSSIKKHFIVNKNPGGSLDADRLLSELEIISEKEDKTEEAFKNLEAEEELDKLKKKLETNE